MIRVNERQLARVSRATLQNDEDRAAFERLFQSGVEQQSIAIFLRECDAQEQDFPEVDTLPLPPWVRRIQNEKAIGSSDRHQSGAIYVMDFSSAAVASTLCSEEVSGLLASNPITLDLCSSPGGKAIFTTRALSPRFLICNEVIGKRHAALTSNLQRCAIPNAVVTGHDPEHFAKDLPSVFELILVDAPCSGQSLVLKGLKVDGAFHEQTQKRNAMRQRRILGNAFQALAPGGVLLYSTCTYGKIENEDIVQWVCKQRSDVELVEVSRFQSQRSPLIEAPSYRFWPQRHEGAGAFCAVFRKAGFGSPDQTITEICEKIRVKWASRGPSFTPQALS